MYKRQVLKRENVKKLFLLGVSSEDISSPWIQAGNLGALRDNRVEIYPYRHKPTRILLRYIPDNRSVQIQRGFFSNILHWKELEKQNVAEWLFHLLEKPETKQVYVSIDKDCLTASHSLTNWEEGFLGLEELLQLLHLIKTHLNIVGLDIVGDYSPPLVKGWGKAALARIDRPKDYSAKGKPRLMIDAVNERTNLAILDLLAGQSAN